MNGTIAQSWWFVLLGYIVFFIYSPSILMLGTVIEKKTNIDKLICRKLTHIVGALIWVISWFFFGCSIHWIIINLIGAIILGFVTFSDRFLAYARDDTKRSYGLFYFGAVTLVVAVITYLVYSLVDAALGMQLYYAAGIAYFCLTLGDGFAPIIAKAFKKHNPKLMKSRSLIGTASVFVFALLSTVAFSAIFKLQLSFTFMLSVAALTCILEFYGIHGVDNILIDFGVFAYVALYYLGCITPAFQIVVILSPILACLAFLFRLLSLSGGVVTLVLFYLIGYFSDGSYMPILFMGIMFLIASFASVIARKVKRPNEEKGSCDHARTGGQIIAVGAAAAISLIIHYFTREPVFCLIYYVCITEQFADSISSDIGCLTRGKNLDILRWRPVAKGISGGVSLLGTALALISSYAMMLIPFLAKVVDMSLECYIFASAIAFFGTLLDSFFGSGLQALYRCPKCDVLTELEHHCDGATVLVKGFRSVKNATVNIITSICSFLLGLLLLLVI